MGTFRGGIHHSIPLQHKWRLRFQTFSSRARTIFLIQSLKINKFYMNIGIFWLRMAGIWIIGNHLYGLRYRLAFNLIGWGVSLKLGPTVTKTLKHNASLVAPGDLLTACNALCLQNPKWPLGGPKMADGVWKGVYLYVSGHSCQLFWSKHSFYEKSRQQEWKKGRR